MESIEKIKGWHAHGYFDEGECETREKAKALMVLAENNLANAEVGDWRDSGSGPHPGPNFLVEFHRDAYSEILPWLSFNRNGLSVLVHPMTGDAPSDHSTYAMWMGDKLDVHLDCFSGRHDKKFGL